MKLKPAWLTAALVFFLLSAPAWAAGGDFGLTLLGGYVHPTNSEAMAGRDGDSGPASSGFKDTWTLGAEAIYRLPQGLALGLGVQYLELTADAARQGNSETEFANLQLTPVYVLARYIHPVKSGLTGHLEAGLGYAFAKAGKEAGIEAMEAGIGESVSIDAKDNVCAFVGAGADWFFTPAWSLGLGLRYWWMESDYDMKTDRLGNIEKGAFQADNLQCLLSLTYWFGN